MEGDWALQISCTAQFPKQYKLNAPFYTEYTEWS